VPLVLIAFAAETANLNVKTPPGQSKQCDAVWSYRWLAQGYDPGQTWNSASRSAPLQGC
jgi:hypothetical protein